MVDKEAKKAYMKAYHEANKEKRRASHKEWYAANKEKKRADSKAWGEANKERKRASHKEWYEANKEKKKADGKEYREANRHRVNAHTAKRRASKMQRTPPWASLDKIEEMYELAQLATDVSGIQYHVDHIVPLQGTHVSGLHIHENLQVIPATENLSKGNRFAS